MGCRHSPFNGHESFLRQLHSLAFASSGLVFFAIIGRQFLLVVIVDCLLDVTCAAVASFDCVAVEYFPERVLVGKTLVYQDEEFLSDVCLHAFAKRWVVP